MKVLDGRGVGGLILGGVHFEPSVQCTFQTNTAVSFIPYPISDSIWLANSSLLVGAGNQMRLYGPPDKSRATSKDEESLFEFVTRQNGPLEDYHPQILLQCLLWGMSFSLPREMCSE